MKYLICAASIIFLYNSCIRNKPEPVWGDSLFSNLTDTDTWPSPGAASEYLRFSHRMITGDFNGDGIKDSLCENNINGKTRVPIDSFPATNIWDSMVEYFSVNSSVIILTSTIKGLDTLIVGGGFRLFCLINLGDNNKDGKDEVALAVDYCDYSNLNFCSIYTICEKKWIRLKSFSIHESAFDPYDKTNLSVNQIIGFLEKRNGIWKYADYMNKMRADTEDEWNKMNTLKVPACKQK